MQKKLYLVMEEIEGFYNVGGIFSTREKAENRAEKTLQLNLEDTDSYILELEIDKER